MVYGGRSARASTGGKVLKRGSRRGGWYGQCAGNSSRRNQEVRDMAG